MADKKMTTIQSRLGPRDIDLDKIIRFPRGIIGFEHLRDFTLLEVKEGAPLLILQSLEQVNLGLLVADPFAFMDEYNVRVSDADQEVLQAKDISDLAVLVTASIPPGRPEQTALNLLGPVVINHKKRLGLQAPQTDLEGPAKVFIHSHELGGGEKENVN